MNTFKFYNKISTKISFSFSFSFLLILLLLNIIIYFSLKSNLDYFEKSLLISKNEFIVEEITSVLETNPDSNEIIVKKILKKNAFRRDTIYTNLKFADKTYKSYIDVNLSFIKNLNKITEIQTQNSDTHRYLYLNTVLITPTGDSIYIQNINSLKASDDLLEKLMSTMILIDVVGFFLAIITGIIFAKKTLKPITSIADTAEMINLNNLHQRIKSSNSDDEIGRLINVINNMMERLELSFENQTKFISDASHELRTPLAIINGYIDLLNQWGTSNKELTQEALSSIKEEVFNMKGLMEKLLFIAREENTKHNLNMTDVSVPNLLNKVYKEFKMIDVEHNYKISETHNFLAFIDENLILQAIRALVENAIKYTPKGKNINFSCEEGKSYFKIIIEDRGIGIPEEHLPKLFGRFYRVDEARTKDTGGNGLGLSIVKSIIDMHNGQILIESKVNKGTIITLKLPR